jgi:hypothetical protein
MRARDEIVTQQRTLELELLQAAFKSQMEPLRQFFVTTTQPPLCFLPAVHNEATTALLNTQREMIDAKIAERCVSVSDCVS